MSTELERVFLPIDVSPSHYSLGLTPNLESLEFCCNEVIDVDVTMGGQTEDSIHSKEVFIETVSFKSAGSESAPFVVEISYYTQYNTVKLFDGPLPEGNGQIMIRFRGIPNSGMCDFYKYSYADANGNKKVMVRTQSEALDARRAFTFWDEPVAKATIAVTLIVPAHLTAISNMPETSTVHVPAPAAQHGINSGKQLKKVTFEVTPKMSTNLLAWCVGEFDFVQGISKRGVMTRVLSPPQRGPQGEFTLDVGIRSLDFYVPYPLPKLDMICITELATGAMENWGLVTYREVALMIDAEAASPPQKQRVAIVVAHELVHQWFGKLVAMQRREGREGSAAYMGHFCVDDLFSDSAEYKIWEQFTTDGYSTVQRLDALRSSHSVIVPIKHAEEVDQVFDTISYCKGSTVVRMVDAILGLDKFEFSSLQVLTTCRWPIYKLYDTINPPPAVPKCTQIVAASPTDLHSKLTAPILLLRQSTMSRLRQQAQPRRVHSVHTRRQTVSSNINLLLLLLCAFFPLHSAQDVDLGSLSASKGFSIIGAAADDLSGYSVSAAGDVNGDGIDDVIVGANGANPGTGSGAGISYVIFGRNVPGGATAFGDIQLTTGTTAMNINIGFRILGAAADDCSGWSVSAAGDVNGDGIDDIMVGAYRADPASGADAGISYVIFGRDIPGGASAFGDIQLTTGTTALSADIGFRILGAAVDNYSGRSVSAAGDVNGDGICDVIVGAYKASPTSGSKAGISYVIFGRNVSAGATAFGDIQLTTAALSVNIGFRILGAAADDQTGWSVSAAGDVNGDGIDDVIVGANGANPGTGRFTGISHVIFGRDIPGGAAAFGDIQLTTGTTALSADIGFRILGAAASDQSGVSVNAAGDVNGDGVGDVIVGSYGADPTSGSTAGISYVIFGRNISAGASAFGDIQLTNDADPLSADIGFRILGAATFDQSGWSVSAAGDVNKDGIDDIIVGARNADPGAGRYTGISYVIFGRDIPGGATAFGDIQLTTGTTALSADIGFRILGAAAGDKSGWSVSAAGDVNGDGTDDVIVGAPLASPASGAEAGMSYVLLGTYKDSASSLPSGQPSSQPSMQPTSQPISQPTQPSSVPTFQPLASPTTQPSSIPSYQPSVSPTMQPTSQPSGQPSTSPSEKPSAQPSAHPSTTSTLSPTAGPTSWPTSKISQKVELGIQQIIYLINKTDYDAQKQQCDLTIQYTVADVMDGVVPERVTDISVEEEEEEEEEEESRRSNLRALVPASTANFRSGVSLRYKVTVYDSVVSADVLTAQLKAKVASGDMDTAFRTYAEMLNATNMQNGTFGEPKVTVLNGQGRFDDPPNSGETAALVVGVLLFFLLLTGGVSVIVKCVKPLTE